MSPKRIFLSAPDGTIDKPQLDLIESKWDENPTAIQILEVLDSCVRFAACPEWLILAMDTFLHIALDKEGKTMEDILPLATWRNQC